MYDTRCQGIIQFFTCHPRVYPRMKRTTPASAFPAEADPHLSIPEGWKAELA